jgi:hypothetical protein
MPKDRSFIDSGGFRGRRFVERNETQTFSMKGRFLRFRVSSYKTIDLELNGAKLATISIRNMRRLAYWILDTIGRHDAIEEKVAGQG